jgi:hypothetical protein
VTLTHDGIRRSGGPLAVLVLLLLACDAHRLGAQAVEGRITDASTEAPVGGATLELVNDMGAVVRSASSDSRGWFTLRAPRPGVYRIRASRIGYREGISQPVDLVGNGTVAVELRMSTGAVALDPVTVVGIPHYARLEAQGFYEREELFGEEGLREGVFLEQHEIERMNPFHISDLFRNVRGVRVSNGRVLMRRGCQPAIVIDGFTVLNGSMPNRTSVSRIPPLARGEISTPRALMGVEVYTGLAIPARYMLDAGGCGVIMYWTR